MEWDQPLNCLSDSKRTKLNEKVDRRMLTLVKNFLSITLLLILNFRCLTIVSKDLDSSNQEIITNSLTECNVSWKLAFWSRHGDFYLDKNENSKYNELLKDTFVRAGFKNFIDYYKKPAIDRCKILLDLEKIEEKFIPGEFAFFGIPFSFSSEFKIEISIISLKGKNIRKVKYENRFKRYYSWLLLPTLFLFSRPFIEENMIEDAIRKFIIENQDVTSEKLQ